VGEQAQQSREEERTDTGDEGTEREGRSDTIQVSLMHILCLVQEQGKAAGEGGQAAIENGVLDQRQSGVANPN
jgi:hypothetical protein